MTRETETLPVIDEQILEQETEVVKRDYRIDAFVHQHNISEAKALALCGGQVFDPYVHFFFPRGEHDGYAKPNPIKHVQEYQELLNPEKQFGERILADMLKNVIAADGQGSHAEKIIIKRLLVFYRKKSSVN